VRERVLVRRGVFAVLARVVPAVTDFARGAAGFFAALAFRGVVLRAVVDFAPVEVLRAPVERFAPVLRAAVELVAPSSAVHLPDMTRCAASATASAINVPSLVALAITLLAA
jgi:hypothetical protein